MPKSDVAGLREFLTQMVRLLDDFRVPRTLTVDEKREWGKEILRAYLERRELEQEE